MPISSLVGFVSHSGRTNSGGGLAEAPSAIIDRARANPVRVESVDIAIRAY